MKRLEEDRQFWWDMRHNEDGTISVGIESLDESLTFDGHFVCIFPEAKEEDGAEGAIERAERIVDLLNGKSDS